MGGSASKASEAARQAAPKAASALKPRSAPLAPSTAAPATSSGAASVAPTRDAGTPGVDVNQRNFKPADSKQRPESATPPQQHSRSEARASAQLPKQDTWRPPGAPPVSPAAAEDLYSGGSSGDEDDSWQSDPAAASMLNQLAGSIRQRGRPGEAEHTGPVEIPQIRRKEMPPDLRERVNVEDLKGVFIKVQQADLSGQKFDSDAEAARLGMIPSTLRDALKFTSLPWIKKTPDGEGERERDIG